MNAQEFVAKWARVKLCERAASQEHFIDLCRLLGHETPAAADPEGSHFCFEKGVRERGGGGGFADVWKKGFFAWEYKTKDKYKSLDEAYDQLNRYREALDNPPLLIISDIARFEIHTNFTGTSKKKYAFTNDDIGNGEILNLLRNTFFSPERLKPTFTQAKVTEEAAEEFCTIADMLRRRKVDPHEAAHYLMKIIFCLFAEDVGLLPKGLFARLVEKTSEDPKKFSEYAKQLFGAMEQGGSFLMEDIYHFNGGLFADAKVIDLTREELKLIAKVAKLDWSSVEPAIFGTLFERSLNPDKRTQLGAHYTSYQDIITIVEPVLITPLRREWDKVKATVEPHIRKFQEAKSHDRAGRKARLQVEGELIKFMERLRHVKVLDPACGSGNFLYVSLKLIKDLEKEVISYGLKCGFRLIPYFGPDQLFGIETNVYAQELASVVVWIGYIQWMRDNGFSPGVDPVLRPLNNIVREDAILDLSDREQPKEPEWPEVDVIVGNPPFLGGKFLRRDLGDNYVEAMFKLYGGRVPHEADLVCYWFEKARAMLEVKRAHRAGLLATQGVRGGSNRKVLERIKKTGDIFFGISDREWMLDGAMVHVSMVGFDDGSQKGRSLNGNEVSEINADLSSGANVTEAALLICNRSLSFMGDTKGGKFDISNEKAQEFLKARNPHGRPNSDVIKPWVNGKDILQVPRRMWIIDFGTEMTREEAALYEAPFEYVKKHVKPARDKNNRATYRERWWIHVEPRPAMRSVFKKLKRYIATPRVAKHRIFVWLSPEVLPDCQLIVVGRGDDYCFGVLHSQVHEVWSRRKGTQLREASSGCRYTPTTTFETFPFPWPLGTEPRKGKADYEKVRSIEAAAAELVVKRDNWLLGAGGKGRTLTQLYNQRPTWLVDAHKALDSAVLAAYGWPEDISDGEMLGRLVDVNNQQARIPMHA